jgi:hypothetical protein
LQLATRLSIPESHPRIASNCHEHKQEKPLHNGRRQEPRRHLKVMGAVADKYDMPRGFIVPSFCFAFVAFYGFNWPKFSGAESLNGVRTAGGH